MNLRRRTYTDESLFAYKLFGPAKPFADAHNLTPKARALLAELQPTMKEITHAYALGQGALAGFDRAHALRGFYVWLLQHEVAS